MDYKNMLKKFLRSVCNKITNKKVVEDYQSSVKNLTLELVDYKQQASRLELVNNKQYARINELGRENETLQCKVDALLNERNQLLNAPPKVVYEDRFVMTHQVYDKFARSLEAPIVTNNTTAQGAGYLVGMQRVLEKLREQFVA